MAWLERSVLFVYAFSWEDLPIRSTIALLIEPTVHGGLWNSHVFRYLTVGVVMKVMQFPCQLLFLLGTHTLCWSFPIPQRARGKDVAQLFPPE